MSWDCMVEMDAHSHPFAEYERSGRFRKYAIFVYAIVGSSFFVVAAAAVVALFRSPHSMTMLLALPLLTMVESALCENSIWIIDVENFRAYCIFYGGRARDTRGRTFPYHSHFAEYDYDDDDDGDDVDDNNVYDTQIHVLQQLHNRIFEIESNKRANK